LRFNHELRLNILAPPASKCPTCRGDLIQKSRARLLAVGVLLVFSPVLAWFVPLLWAPAIVFTFTGLYLLAWAILGRGRWCRNCKKFSPGA
jgi:Flp pilus assembly protein TadB